MEPSIEDRELLSSLVRDVPNFPKEGIIFKDIQPLMADSTAFAVCTYLMSDYLDKVVPRSISGIVSIEARGFLFGAPLAYAVDSGHVMLRKQGKLPPPVESESYDLEYGSATIEVGQNVIKAGGNYVIVDDVLATGGTALAAANLIEKLGGKVEACLFPIELKFLEGRSKLDKYRVASILKY